MMSIMGAALNPTDTISIVNSDSDSLLRALLARSLEQSAYLYQET